MAKCNFDIDYSQEMDKAKDIITEEVTSNNGDIQINDDAGAFTISIPGGEVTGSVAFEDNTISVSITDKPTFIPCDLIKSVIQSFL